MTTSDGRAPLLAAALHALGDEATPGELEERLSALGVTLAPGLAAGLRAVGLGPPPDVVPASHAGHDRRGPNSPATAL